MRSSCTEKMIDGFMNFKVKTIFVVFFFVCILRIKNHTSAGVTSSLATYCPSISYIIVHVDCILCIYRYNKAYYDRYTLVIYGIYFTVTTCHISYRNNLQLHIQRIYVFEPAVHECSVYE